MIFRLECDQLVQRQITALRETFFLALSDRADLTGEFQKHLKAGLQLGRCSRQPCVNHASPALVAYLLDPFTESSLPAIILARDPYQEGRHRSREVSLPGSLLALGENSAVHITGTHVYNQQPGADTLPARYVFAGCEHQGAWRSRGAWVPGTLFKRLRPCWLPFAPAEQPFCNAV